MGVGVVQGCRCAIGIWATKCAHGEGARQGFRFTSLSSAETPDLLLDRTQQCM